MFFHWDMCIGIHIPLIDIPKNINTHKKTHTRPDMHTCLQSIQIHYSEQLIVEKPERVTFFMLLKITLIF